MAENDSRADQRIVDVLAQLCDQESHLALVALVEKDAELSSSTFRAI